MSSILSKAGNSSCFLRSRIFNFCLLTVSRLKLSDFYSESELFHKNSFWILLCLRKFQRKLIMKFFWIRATQNWFWIQSDSVLKTIISGKFFGFSTDSLWFLGTGTNVVNKKEEKYVQIETEIEIMKLLALQRWLILEFSRLEMHIFLFADRQPNIFIFFLLWIDFFCKLC